ncbi:DUF1801 domain-containing protein [Chryseolinea sp. H1M3-3]|uniref:DUF1801 domain-containing protein n=1 Tax=Chryseolinea sp. H1M3-3 TaxID=3034144 RepID=UPI0023ED7C30|nr:DUF1801 domain-containing protein [Chryseolinea sp. H1M3-3]
MAEQKTKPTEVSVESFLETIPDENRRDDCFALVKMMKKITGAKPKMWGTSIVGFGIYHYKYDSGHEGFSCLTGFSPRKQNISLYVMPGSSTQQELLQELGKHKAGKGCLYIKRLADVNSDVLERLIKMSVDNLKEKYK